MRDHMRFSPFLYTEPFSLKRPRDVCHGFGVKEPKRRLEEEDEKINGEKKITNDNPNRGDTGRKTKPVNSQEEHRSGKIKQN